MSYPTEGCEKFLCVALKSAPHRLMDESRKREF
jgi:hypothetical protein